MDTTVPNASGLALPGRSTVSVLDNGLTLVQVENHQAPIVTTVLLYRAGTRDEVEGRGGAAHFLEHMMFKGSPRFPAGEVDRLTLALGGSNNAFTSHDLTAYHFQFAAEHWRRALEVEADRMAALDLLVEEFESERRVILEEIAMYDSEPWSALDAAVSRELYGRHPYGNPVLGTRDELLGIDLEHLREFHRRHYTPDRAVLVVAGSIDGEVAGLVADAFGSIETRAPARPGPSPVAPLFGLRRVERRQGTVPRMLLALLAPPAADPDHAVLRLLLTILVGGRAARLQRSLVEELKLCVWLTGELRENQGASSVAVALEPAPGIDDERVETAVLEGLAELRRGGVSPEELTRARRVMLADWVFAHERIHQQAFLTGFAASLFDLAYPERYLEHLLAADPADLERVARRYLDPEHGAVVGWSLPADPAA